MAQVNVIRGASASFPVGSSSQGFDLCADMKQPKTIDPGDSVIIPTGITIEIPEGFCALICANSTLAQRNSLMIANTPAIVRSRIPIEISLLNVGKTVVTIDPGKRIAVLLILPVDELNLVAMMQGVAPTKRLYESVPCPAN